MISVALSAALATQILGNSYPVELLKESYSEIFETRVLEHQERKFVSRRIAVLPSDHPLSDFVKENHWFIHYLQMNGTEIDPRSLSALKDEPQKLAAYYHSSLREDAEFNSLLVPVARRFLAQKGIDLFGYAAPPRERITFKELINVAVRFFYPHAVTEDGKLRGHICVGINGLRDFEGERNLHVEAFCYESIFLELGSKEQKYGLKEKFMSLLLQARLLKLSANADTRVARAQGVVWAILAQDPDLTQLLTEAYERKKDYLPFEIASP